MGNYLMCPNCGNTKGGDYLYRCDKCGAVFCSACCIKHFFTNSECPKCGKKPNLFGQGWTTLGKITRKP